MSKNKKQDLVGSIVEALALTGEALGLHPTAVTRSQLINNSSISDYMLRKAPGLIQIKNTTWPIVDKDLVSIRETAETSKYVRQLEKKLGDKNLLQKQTLESVQKAIKEIKWNKVKVAKPKLNKHKKSMTLELMISDIHIGKVTKDFSLPVAKSRLQELVKVFMEEYYKESKDFNVKEIILALIGDMLESYTMHGLESAKNCEFGNAEQIRWAIELVMAELIDPLAALGVPMRIPAICGNHDRVEKEKTMSEPGKHYMSWVVYHSLRMISSAKGYKHVEFIIPETSNCVLAVYNSNIIYEHGDNLKATDRRGLESFISKRAIQHGKILHMMRSGHWHEYLALGRGKFIINESLCGQDGYSETMGFDSHAGQTINYYVETKERPNCFYKSFPVYLG